MSKEELRLEQNIQEAKQEAFEKNKIILNEINDKRKDLKDEMIRLKTDDLVSPNQVTTVIIRILTEKILVLEKFIQGQKELIITQRQALSMRDKKIEDLNKDLNMPRVG